MVIGLPEGNEVLGIVILAAYHKLVVPGTTLNALLGMIALEPLIVKSFIALL
jgi:hypothetical protein